MAEERRDVPMTWDARGSRGSRGLAVAGRPRSCLAVPRSAGALEARMASSRIFGILLIVVGVVLLGLAYQQSEGILDQTKHLLTGEFRDKTTWMMIGGVVATVLGIGALALPRRP